MNAWLTSARIARRDLTRHRWRSLAAVLLFALPVMAVLVFAGAVLSERTTDGTDPTRAYATAWLDHTPCTADGDDLCEGPDAATVAKTDHERLTENLGIHPGSLIAVLDTEVRITTPRGTSSRSTATALPGTLDGAPEPGSFMMPGSTAEALGLEPGAPATVTVLDAAGDAHTRELTYVGPTPGSTFLSLADVPGSESIGTPDFTGATDGTPWSVGYLVPLDSVQSFVGPDAQSFRTSGIYLTFTGGHDDTDPYVAPDVFRALMDRDAIVNWVVLTFALLVIIAVVTPIFAVAARRQTRLMGLLSATGAAPVHLRRVLLIQGLMIGAVGAVLGSVLSIPVERVLVGAINPGADVHWPWDLALLIVATSLLVGVGAALLPALKTGRQDPVVALRGGRSVRIRRFSLPMVIGPVIMLIALILRAIEESPFIHILTQPLLGLGLVLTAPILLWGTAALAGRFRLPGRLASRDALRSMTRTAPAVGAIAGITFVSTTFLSILWFPATTHDEGNRLPDASVLFLPTEDVDFNPDAAHEGISDILDKPHGAQSDLFAPRSDDWGATDWEGLAAAGTTTADDEYYFDLPLFRGWAAHGLPGVHTNILINDGSAVTALEGLTDEQRTAIRTALDEGEIVVTDPDLTVDGVAAFGRTVRSNGASAEHREKKYAGRLEAHPEELRDRLVDESGFLTFRNHGDTAEQYDPGNYEVRTHPATVVPLDGPGVSLLTPATAAKIGMETTYAGTLVTTLEPVSTVDSFRLDAKVTREKPPFRAETANRPLYELLTWMIPSLFAGLISYGIVVLLMLLAAAESRRDTDILTAIGGSPRILARYVGAQGLIIGLGGTLAGTLFAFIPLLVEMASTDMEWFPRYVFDEIGVGPWSIPLLITLVGVPLLAWATGLAIGGWIAGHRRPLSDRRE
ncbi:FtsX-like permease family protein [Corynebacterium sp. P5875]|uniref:FtsX-like permease family protein n=1 Tax=Corynebacterium antarcticum TaxID=2800405 RepID=A0A9Q4GKA8_9CORY|nr:FtsX-like permease family protein [Corynebacterium antarcticum]MCX7537880.1 FtsX-like permease family protein [Corynebacterium antarcticum]